MTNKNKSSFEAKIEKIEKIIDNLQSSQVGIDDSLILLEEAQNLAIECNKILSDAELKFSELREKFSSNDNLENH
ncbi:MAG: exodeoxyribonuclease VII small subunit [Chloroflexi bacterium]|nr:exodeoxyribonuclease VII small subunit [Chloroflexota bacterium]MBR92461.1 exodeoxyribonuclease VII small subunit [Dehalococcoidia bacterium]|tara:strand:- start:9563 stop:9787 length:225 start_codon:yes stop_codon:yes gene_type:complete